MSVAGYQKVIQVKATGTSVYTAGILPGNTASLNFGGDMLDDTDFTSTGWRSRIRGLKDYSIPITLVYDTGSSGANLIRDSLFSGASLDVQYLPNGTKGFTGRVKVESFNLSGDVGGLETVDVSLQSDGTALTTV